MNSFWRLARPKPAPTSSVPTAPFFERRPELLRYPLVQRRRSLFHRQRGQPDDVTHFGNAALPPFLSAGQSICVTQTALAGAPFFNQLEKDIWTPQQTTRQQPSPERHPSPVRRCRTLQ